MTLPAETGGFSEVPAVSAVRQGSRAVVVFTGETDLCLLRFLKPGFRHCCLLIEAGRFWLFYNPTSRCTEIVVYDGLNLNDIADWFLSNRQTVVCCLAGRPLPMALPFRPYTCVEAVKRVLGVRERAVLTPWQLFQFLVRDDGSAQK